VHQHNQSIWVADDDPAIRTGVSDFLSSRGFDAFCLDSGDAVLTRLNSTQAPALLILDMLMPRMSGLEVLAELADRGRQIPTIVLSGTGQIRTVVKAMRLGASDFLAKPLDENDLEAAILRTIREPAGPAGSNTAISKLSPCLSSNKRMLQIQAICEQVASADVPVLILGESGVGKEVLARFIHARSGRLDPFVRVNCAALPADLLESELFGHERGAFTGAQRDKPGKFELAGHGTVMLDEIAELSPQLQAKLLHVLQDGEYTRLGGTRNLKSDARILSATNKNLSALVAKGAFREDLYFRLNVITVEVPPLRECSGDIRPLCDHFVEKYRAKYNSCVQALPEELIAAYSRYGWPGNIRQLENAVKRFLILPGLQQALAELERGNISAEGMPSPVRVSLREFSVNAAEKAEKELILRTLNEVNWNRKEAARRLNTCYKSLRNKLRRWQLPDQTER
jgi:two-component system response regulator AtoC